MADYSISKDPTATKLSISKDPTATEITITKNPGATKAYFTKNPGGTKVFVKKNSSGGVVGPSGSGFLLESAGTNYLLAENDNYLIQEG